MTRPLLPVGYGTSTRAYQVWDTDTNQFIIENIKAIEDLIVAEGNFNVIPTGAQGRIGNKLISYLDGTFEVALDIRTLNNILSGTLVTVVDLTSLLPPLVPIQTQNGYVVGPNPTSGGEPIILQSNEGIISFTPALFGVATLLANSRLCITMQLIPLEFIRKFKV